MVRAASPAHHRVRKHTEHKRKKPKSPKKGKSPKGKSPKSATTTGTHRPKSGSAGTRKKRRT